MTGRNRRSVSGTVLGNLPIIAAIAITVLFSTETPIDEFLKTEQSFGVWVTVLIPLAILLLLAQIAVWALRPRTRPWTLFTGAARSGRSGSPDR